MGDGDALLLSIDQGTSSSRALIFDRSGAIIARAQQEFSQIYPGDGWVEHDPEAIWTSTVETCREAAAQIPTSANIAGIGITNQRETTVVWDRTSGAPIYNAIVWQDRRTAQYCHQLKARGLEPAIHARTGLLLDPYFSASKIHWILENVEDARNKAERGDLAFGTVDSFLIWRLTEGRQHLTDATNASRTLLFNIHTGKWDPELLKIFQIPESMLPEVKNCADDFGVTEKIVDGVELPIASAVGDQQGALVGQACFQPGMVKSTYGTGCFMMLNTGKQALDSENRLLTTIGYQLDGEISYALEGSIFNAGTTIQWLRDGLGVIQSASDVDDILLQTEDNQGLYLVPAFTGLGAPHWQPDARGLLCGITRNTDREHLVRAAVESVGYQSQDLLEAMIADGAQAPDEIRVDGGMAVNDWLLQFLADITQTTISRPRITETTALGAACLAGLQLGLLSSLDEIAEQWCLDTRFKPAMRPSQRDPLLKGWKQAISRCL